MSIAVLLTCLTLVAVDGDTIKCDGVNMRDMDDGAPFVSGYDTPEIWSVHCDRELELGRAAKASMEELLATHGVQVFDSGEVDDTPSHRPLVWVLLPNGRSAGAILIEEGHARRWTPDYEADWCEGAINAWHVTPAFEEPPLRLAQNECHPSYADVCVPIASDVDCAGGSGNGPEYVRGPFRVIGPDVYDLDRDNDGIACENG